jgi:hypothetical protein
MIAEIPTQQQTSMSVAYSRLKQIHLGIQRTQDIQLPMALIGLTS